MAFIYSETEEANSDGIQLASSLFLHFLFNSLHLQQYVVEEYWAPPRPASSTAVPHLPQQNFRLKMSTQQTGLFWDEDS